MRQKEKLLVLSNFFFCHYIFKKSSAAEASERIYMRFERVNVITRFWQIFFPSFVNHETINWLVINLNPFPYKNAFWRVCSRQLLTTLWQKEKLHFKRNFSFCLNVLKLFSISISSSTEIYQDFARVLSVVCCRFVVFRKWFKH